MSAPVRSIPPGIRSPARRKITNKAIGDEVSFILYSTESPQQRVFKIRCIVKPGGGVPLHYHRNCTEHFKVLKGVLTAVNGSAVLKLGVGEETLIPVMTDHLFRNDTEGECEFEGTPFPKNLLGAFLADEGIETATLEPGVDPNVLLGFQQSLYILYGLANDGLCDEEAKPKSLVDAAVALRLGDFMFAGGLSYRMMTGAMFGIADWIGWWSGREEELLKRYWD